VSSSCRISCMAATSKGADQGFRSYFLVEIE
jgi:hypothetical protein